MSKIIVLQGVPASGKSTLAKELVKDREDWVIVNRDSIRESTGQYWVPSREEYVTSLETHAVRAAIEQKLNVVIDATNLNRETILRWETIAKTYHVEIEFKELKISVEEALQRDADRAERGERSVGKKIILRFFHLYYPELLKEYYTDKRIQQYEDQIKEQRNLSMLKYRPSAVIIDLDGTIAIHNGRGAFDYEQIHTDILNKPLYELLTSLYDTSNCPDGAPIGDYILPMSLIFISGREGTDIAKRQTIEWLQKYFGEDFQLFMRKIGDYRPDEIIKREIYENSIKPDYNVIAVFDDRNKVVKMWRDLGLLCCQVNEGDF